MAAGARDLERGDAELAQDGLLPRERELRSDEDHVHRQPAAASLDEELLGGREHLGGAPPGRVGVEERAEAVAVDPDALPHGLELLGGLDGPGQVERLVEGHAVERRLEGAPVTGRHHVVEAVDADPASGEALGEPATGMVDEDLVLDPGRPVLADVAGLAREHQRRFALEREEDVGVAVHDLESRQVRHRPLEAGVLGAGDDQGVQLVTGHRLPHARVAALDLAAAHHERSSPFTSAQTARLSGVATPCSSPARTMPPFR